MNWIQYTKEYWLQLNQQNYCMAEHICLKQINTEVSRWWNVWDATPNHSVSEYKVLF